MGINLKAIQIKCGVWCKWDKPSPEWFKPNIDGSVRDGNVTGGGIIRNTEGKLVASFSIYYGEGTKNMAEFLVLKDGMLLCKQLNVSPVFIESDSMLTVSAVTTTKVDNW